MNNLIFPLLKQQRMKLARNELTAAVVTGNSKQLGMKPPPNTYMPGVKK